MASLQKYQTKEVLNKILNSNEDGIGIEVVGGDSITITNATFADSPLAIDGGNTNDVKVTLDSEEVVVADSGVIATMQDDIALMKADIAAIKAVTDQMTFGAGSAAGTALEVKTYS